MVARIIAVGRVREIDRRPALRRMADIAFLRGNKMILRTLGFTADRYHTVVTGTAAIRNPLVIPGTADEGRGGMAVVAVQAGRDVCVRLAGRRHTIVAGLAVVHDAGMIERRTGEAGSDGMADTAILTGRHMRIRLAGGEHPVMTRRTVIHDAGMVERGGQKTCGYVALAAVTIGWHVVRWGCFSSGGHAIVASITTARREL